MAAKWVEEALFVAQIIGYDAASPRFSSEVVLHLADDLSKVRRPVFRGAAAERVEDKTPLGDYESSLSVPRSWGTWIRVSTPLPIEHLAARLNAVAKLISGGPVGVPLLARPIFRQR
jgi:hypothetical protein